MAILLTLLDADVYEQIGGFPFKEEPEAYF